MMFKFKQFDIRQEKNAHKIGTDSMLLGAWTKGDFKKILDIGTGTGILALMMAQVNPKAYITAIEPDLLSFEEAKNNFENSPFSSNILPIHSTLQYFGSMEKFDLIIANPPYFENSYLSEDPDRNRARHTSDLPIYELYECVNELLEENGQMNVIVPSESESTHIERAFDNDLFIKEVLHLKSPNGKIKRSILVFVRDEKEPKISSLFVRDKSGAYTFEYIELTKDFHGVKIN